MKKLQKFIPYVAAVLALVMVTGIVCFQAGRTCQQAEDVHFISAVSEVAMDRQAEAERLISAFSEAMDHYEVRTNSVCAYLMPEYGMAPLGSTELSSDTTYRVCLDIPAGYYQNEYSDTFRRAYKAGNNVHVKFFYPKEVRTGEQGKIVVLVNIDGYDDTIVSAVDFTATDRLRLINGGSTPCYDSSGGDLSFDDGALKIQFYTGASADFKHPASSELLSSNSVSCEFYPY